MYNIATLILMLFTLSGCLPTIFGAAAKTTMIASRDKSFSGAISDIKLSAQIKKAFITEGFRELYTKIDVEVIQGRVMYTGTVQTEEDIMKAVEIAWKQEGVKEVINELKVDENSNHFDSVQFTKDTWITGQIKAKIVMHRGLKVANYSVVTYNNIVYLFGLAKSEQELESVAHLAAETMGVAEVVSHIIIRVPTDDKFVDESTPVDTNDK